jgi:alginate O-acetyltransferase complex protein AlgI
MSITSITFAAFVVVVLGIYYALPGTLQRWWLLLASYAFYATYGWTFPLALLVLTVVNYALGLRVRRGGTAQRPLLRAGVGANIAALAFFKCGNLLVPTVSSRLAAAGLVDRHLVIEVLLPIGFSFYVLQAISYLVDVSRGQIPAETDFASFALYLAYFPKLLSGPIERARTFLPQLKRERIVDNDVVARSLTLIAIGTVRKVVIADSLTAMIPSNAFIKPAVCGAGAYWLVAYAFALYNDFAGYTSIVRGVSGLFGIELSPNFASPFFARSFTEFWNRWHITLAQWLRDYIYLPLSRAFLRRNLSRTNVPNLIVPPMVTMLACGLWHGPSWNMLVWGAIHGTYLVGERLLRLARPVVPSRQRPWWRQGLAMLIVFTLVVVSLIPFHTGLPAAWRFLQVLVRPRAWEAFDPRILILVLPSLWIDSMQTWHGDEMVFLYWPRLARAALLAAAALATFLVLQGDATAPFVYEGF